MKRENVLLVGLAAAFGWYLYTQRAQPGTITTNPVGDALATLGETVTAAIAGWKNVGSGPQWMQTLNAVEIQNNLPTDLLARIAYQESSFRESIIRGTKPSPVGALGIMQMMPQYFQTVNVPRPYTDDDVVAQIEEAAAQVKSLYQSTGDWGLTLAAYNAGLGNVHKYNNTIPPFPETQKYVSQIMADVPALGLA